MNLFDFGNAIQEYFFTNQRADQAGLMLANHLIENPLHNLTIIGYSMGSRIAHEFISRYESEVNQILLFNSSVSRNRCINFKDKKEQVRNGITNYYNENDSTLNILSLIDKKIPNIGPLSAMKEILGLSSPLGLGVSELIENNVAIFNFQGDSHIMATILQNIIHYDNAQNAFITNH